MIYRAGKTQISYGEAIGILLLECHIPYVPGMIANATTFNFPVRYKVVRQASIDRLIYERDPALIQPFIDAGRELVDEGVKALTGNCGFMAMFQPMMAAAINVPVFMSSLMLVPLISRMIGSGQKIGIVTADSRMLDKQLLGAVGVDDTIPIRLADLRQCPHFTEAILTEGGMLDTDQMEQEVVRIVERMMREEESVGAIVLECTDISPFAHAIQKAVKIPVFDIVHLINLVFSAVVAKPYTGFM